MTEFTGRTDFIDWDGLFIGIATLAAFRSKDPACRNGACIVSPDKRQISIGYNGFPRVEDEPTKLIGNDYVYQWHDNGNKSVKYAYVIHAERNALDNAEFDLKNSTLYLYSERGYFPCPECAKGIVQKGVKYVKMSFQNSELTNSQYSGIPKETLKMFHYAGVDLQILRTKSLYKDISDKFSKAHTVEEENTFIPLHPLSY